MWTIPYNKGLLHSFNVSHDFRCPGAIVPGRVASAVANNGRYSEDQGTERRERGIKPGRRKPDGGENLSTSPAGRSTSHGNGRFGVRGFGVGERSPRVYPVGSFTFTLPRRPTTPAFRPDLSVLHPVNPLNPVFFFFLGKDGCRAQGSAD